MPNTFITSLSEYTANEKIGTYLNETFWKFAVINNILVPYHVSIDSLSSTNRVFKYPVESGRGNAVEFSGRDPFKVGITFYVVGETYEDAERQMDDIYSLLDLSVEEPISVFHPILDKYNIDRITILSWSVETFENLRTVKISAEEYNERFVDFIVDGVSTTNEERVSATRVTEEETIRATADINSLT